jgi:hypothetical protein
MGEKTKASGDGCCTFCARDALLSIEPRPFPSSIKGTTYYIS